VRQSNPASNFGQEICWFVKVAQSEEPHFGITRSKDAFIKTIFIASVLKANELMLSSESFGYGTPLMWPNSILDAAT
jgi:hypothetical protein